MFRMTATNTHHMGIEHINVSPPYEIERVIIVSPPYEIERVTISST